MAQTSEALSDIGVVNIAPNAHSGARDEVWVERKSCIHSRTKTLVQSGLDFRLLGCAQRHRRFDRCGAPLNREANEAMKFMQDLPALRRSTLLDIHEHLTNLCLVKFAIWAGRVE